MYIEEGDEYGFLQAKDQTEIVSNKMTLRFPKQAIIFLERNNTIGDSIALEVIFPNETCVTYEIPTLKLWDFTATTLFNNHMYNLMPLIVFLHRKELKKLHPKEDAEYTQIKEDILKDIEVVGKHMQVLHRENILDAEDMNTFGLAMAHLIEHLNGKYFKDDRLVEEVVNMTKTFIDPVIEQRGIELGIEQGFEKGSYKEKVRIAKELMERALDDVTIATITQLTLEQVEGLRQEH